MNLIFHDPRCGGGKFLQEAAHDFPRLIDRASKVMAKKLFTPKAPPDVVSLVLS